MHVDFSPLFIGGMSSNWFSIKIYPSSMIIFLLNGHIDLDFLFFGMELGIVGTFFLFGTLFCACVFIFMGTWVHFSSTFSYFGGASSYFFPQSFTKFSYAWNMLHLIGIFTLSKF
jgi:hypothetical protein